MSNYLFNLSKTNFAPNVVNSSPYNNTIPSGDCSNGFPIDKYSGYGVNAWEVLYSIWCSSQNTLGAKFSYNQCLTAAPVNSVCSGPANMFIIRHGEKNSTLPNYSINNNGVYRACQLMTFINQLAKDGYPISYIVTCNPCPYNSADPSMRPMQTASMPSFMLNIPMFIYGGAQDYISVVEGLFSSQFDGLNVLIVWEHSSIQQLCLNILDKAGSIGRLPNSLAKGDDFFNIVNPCPNGNYKCPDTDILNPFYPPDADTVPGVGANTEKYPYWNNDNFDNVFWLSSASPNYTFGFTIFKEPCYTCYPSCGINIGLYQPLTPSCESSYLYYTSTDNVENKCQVPSDWQV